jgi:hypothetical protein
MRGTGETIVIAIESRHSLDKKTRVRPRRSHAGDRRSSSAVATPRPVAALNETGAR